MLLSPPRCCSGWGLQSTLRHRRAGEPLPHLSTLTARKRRFISVALSLKVAFTGSYPAPSPCGARTFLMQAFDRSTRLSDFLRKQGHYNPIPYSRQTDIRKTVCSATVPADAKSPVGGFMSGGYHAMPRCSMASMWLCLISPKSGNLRVRLPVGRSVRR